MHPANQLARAATLPMADQDAMVYKYSMTMSVTKLESDGEVAPSDKSKSCYSCVVNIEIFSITECEILLLRTNKDCKILVF